MKTRYLNIILFTALLIGFVGVQLWLYSCTNSEDFINYTLFAKWINIISIIPLVYTGGTLFSSVTLKHPNLIIGLIVLAVLIASFQSDGLNILYYLKLIPAILIGTLITKGVSKILRKNSLYQLKKKNH